MPKTFSSVAEARAEATALHPSFQLVEEIIAPACGQGFDLHRTAQQVLIFAFADVESGNVDHCEARRVTADEFNHIVCADIALFDNGEVKACAHTFQKTSEDVVALELRRQLVTGHARL